MSETNLQPTQMSGTKPDERKPVMCPWCGWDMVAREGQDIFHGKYHFYVCEGCEATSPIAYSEDTAYAAATKRPPNLPLTREALYYTLDCDAVWRVDKYGNRKVLDGFSAWSGHNDKLFLYFATKPTLDDIEAARKERT